MNGRGLGVEIVHDECRVATAERRRGRPRLIALERLALADVGAAGGHTPAPAARALTALPLARVTHRLLSLPFTDVRTLDQIVPLELRGQLPYDAGDGRIGYELVGRDAQGARVLAILARPHDLDAVRRVPSAAGALVGGTTVAPLALRWLLPPAFSGTVLLADGRESSLTIWRDGAPRALRALAGDARDPTALVDELAWSRPLLGDDASTLFLAGPDASPALADACARCGLASGPLPLADTAHDLTPEAVRAAPVACGLALGALEAPARVPFPAAGTTALIATPRVRRLAMAAALLALVDLGLVRLELAQRESRVRAALRAEAARVLPGEPIVAPRAQLEAAAANARHANSLAAYGTALDRLREVSERIPDGLVIDLTRLTLEGERLLLVGTAPTFEAVDVLRRALVESARLREVATDEVRTTVDGTRVSFRLRARWAARGEAVS